VNTRSDQDLLAERRENVQEQRREIDPTARALLQYHIDEIDRALDARRRRS
jgi:hypothetical protein